MRLRGIVIGALNLFHVEAGEKDEADIVAAQALADIATIGIIQHRNALEAQVVNDQLSNALNSRVVIEQAKGIVAERMGLNMDESFAMLRTYAAQPQPAPRRRRPRRDQRHLDGGRLHTPSIKGHDAAPRHQRRGSVSASWASITRCSPLAIARCCETVRWRVKWCWMPAR